MTCSRFPGESSSYLLILPSLPLTHPKRSYGSSHPSPIYHTNGRNGACPAHTYYLLSKTLYNPMCRSQNEQKRSKDFNLHTIELAATGCLFPTHCSRSCNTGIHSLHTYRQEMRRSSMLYVLEVYRCNKVQATKWATTTVHLQHNKRKANFVICRRKLPPAKKYNTRVPELYRLFRFDCSLQTTPICILDYRGVLSGGPHTGHQHALTSMTDSINL